MKFTMVSVFGIGRSDDLFHSKLRAFALMVAAMQESMTVGQAVGVCRKLCSVLARYDVMTLSTGHAWLPANSCPSFNLIDSVGIEM